MAAVRVPESPTSNRSAGEAHRLGQRRELVQAGVLDTALAEVGHVGPPGDDAPRGPLELDAAPPAAVLARVGFQETLELPGDVGQMRSSNFLYARMINDTAMRRPWIRSRGCADGQDLRPRRVRAPGGGSKARTIRRGAPGSQNNPRAFGGIAPAVSVVVAASRIGPPASPGLWSPRKAQGAGPRGEGKTP
jgi:hypothetical protein